MPGNQVLALSVADWRVIDGEGRLLDVRIAARLGFDRPRDIRKLIERRSADLERVGTLRHGVAKSTGGRPATEYLLNRKQALLVCMWSDTPDAADIQIEIVDVYDAWIGQRALPLPATPKTEALLEHIVDCQERDTRKLDRLFAQNENKRRKIPGWVQTIHVRRLQTLNGACPCCATNRVLNPDGTKGAAAEFDHMTHNSVAQPETSWLICKSCHNKLTFGDLLRTDVAPAFQLYQSRLYDQMHPKPIVLTMVPAPLPMNDRGEQLKLI